ncbi:MAG: TetR/AcrR family transcriptional regulator [Bdellovibrionales bacterium]
MSKQETLKNQILDESVKILGQQGLAGLSLREVAKKLKVTHQAPYHYFPDKNSLLLELKKEGFSRLSRVMEKAIRDTSLPVFQKMETLAMSYFDFCLENPGYFRAMFTSPAEYRSLRVAEAQQAFALLLESVQQLQKEGYLKTQSPEMIAMVCWSSLHGLVSLALDEYPVMGGKYQSRELALQMTRTLHGLYRLTALPS